MRLKFSIFSNALILAAALFFAADIFAQLNHSDLWTDLNETSITISGTREIVPENYRTLHLDIQSLNNIMIDAPKEISVKAKESNFLISLPSPNGEFLTFRVVESPVMESALAERYPEIKTYLGYGYDNRSLSVRFDITPAGFHAMIRSSEGTIFIDPYFKEDNRYYLSYFKKDFTPDESERNFSCELLSDLMIEEQIRQLVEANPFVQTGDELRTYRLACAATGEYTIYHGGTVGLGLAAVVTAINRVNEVYENDVAIRMILVANNDLIIYTNPSTDPYTNFDGFAMLSENQSNIDAVIGNANYDIGHVFSTGGGGVAYLGVICQTGFKARGVTGLSNPIGDPFYIDYVAHEMGHQYGGNHSFNGNAGSCGGGNRNASTAYEPGSGSTIMAYAGICGSQNLQSNSDPYFHNISFVEIVNYTNNGGGNSCAQITATGNQEPVVDAGTGGLTIPIGTPFKLVGSGTDPDGDPLTFCWEEWDLGPAGHPNTPSGNAPIFRSFEAVSSPERYFPKLSDLVNNTQTIGEILPSYSRTLTFRLTVRDNSAGGGGVDYDQVQYSVTNTAGPFLVTQPNTNVTWQGNTTQTITWDVANTSVAPVNVTQVNILLSTDGGYTFTESLISATDNDGSEDVSIPNLPTTQARIKVEAVGNIFFDISNVNFTIEDNPVPVELSAFFAISLGNSVELKWTTITETNNSGFSVERSSDKINFNKITFIEGNGTTTEVHDYNYTDNSVQSGVYYYRLKQIDFDGSFTYSKVIEAEVNKPETFVLSQNYPNPFNPSTVIKFTLPVDSKVNIDLFNSLGELVENLAEAEYGIGYHEVNFNAGDLSNGIYYYRISTTGKDGSNFVSTKKMVLIK